MEALKKVVQTSIDTSDENMDKLYSEIDTNTSSSNHRSSRSSSSSSTKVDPHKYGNDINAKDNIKLKETTDRLKEVESKLKGYHYHHYHHYHHHYHHYHHHYYHHHRHHHYHLLHHHLHHHHHHH